MMAFYTAASVYNAFLIKTNGVIQSAVMSVGVCTSYKSDSRVMDCVKCFKRSEGSSPVDYISNNSFNNPLCGQREKVL